MPVQDHVSDIQEYYKLCHNAYRDAWDLDKNRQLNLGLWKAGSKNLSQALFNLNEEISLLADLSAGKKVLDAGCGVGGTAIHFASRYQCEVHGISIAPNQIELAHENAATAGVQQLCNFSVMDYMHTSFPDQSFDVVTGMESICYAEPKIDFLREAYRLLKPGGFLVMAENLQGKQELSPEEYDCLYTNAFHGCKVKSLATSSEYRENLQKVGFKQVEIYDHTKEIRPSIKRLRRFYYPAWLYNQFYRLIGRPFSATQEANTKMCYYLLSSLDRGLWSYGLIRAVKP
jgi:cyclopropane fatty-acyl-phospholipid synthase-like methyltransferase